MERSVPALDQIGDRFCLHEIELAPKIGTLSELSRFGLAGPRRHARFNHEPRRKPTAMARDLYQILPRVARRGDEASHHRTVQ